MGNSASVVTGAVGNIDREIHVLPKSFVDDARKAVNADKAAASRWGPWDTHAAAIRFKAAMCASPNTKNSEHKPDDPCILRNDGGEQIATTYGEVYADVLNMAYSFLTAAEKKWLDMPSKSLDESGKDAKRKARMNQQSIVSKMRKRLTKLESTDTDAPATRVRSVSVRIVEYINNAIKLAQADEEPGYDATKLVTQLGVALATASAGVPVDKTDDTE